MTGAFQHFWVLTFFSITDEDEVDSLADEPEEDDDSDAEEAAARKAHKKSKAVTTLSHSDYFEEATQTHDEPARFPGSAHKNFRQGIEAVLNGEDVEASVSMFRLMKEHGLLKPVKVKTGEKGSASPVDFMLNDCNFTAGGSLDAIAWEATKPKHGKSDNDEKKEENRAKVQGQRNLQGARILIRKLIELKNIHGDYTSIPEEAVTKLEQFIQPSRSGRQSVFLTNLDAVKNYLEKQKNKESESSAAAPETPVAKPAG